MRRPFFAIEGVDGAGKSSSLERIRRASPSLLRFFKSPPEDISKIRGVYDIEGIPLPARFFFYLSANLYLSREISEACLEGPAACDRFILSTISSHNAFSGKQDAFTEFLKRFRELDGFLPDITIILIAAEQTRADRIAERHGQNNRLDFDLASATKMQLEMLRLVELGLYQSDTEVIDTTNIDLEKVVHRMLDVIESRLKRWKNG